MSAVVRVLVACVLIGLPARAQAASPLAAQAETFLALYNSLYVALVTAANDAEWAAATDVNDKNEGLRTGAGQVMAAFRGDKTIIAQAKALLQQRAKLTPIQAKQLQSVLLSAAQAPGTIPAVVKARVETESRQSAVQDAFVYCLGKKAADGKCDKPSSANDIDGKLKTSVDLKERLAVWQTSKEIGVPLKDGLVKLQKLRNQVAREMGHSSFFALQVADYGMTVPEMLTLLDTMLHDMQPLYGALHTWTARQLAARYSQPVPAGSMPAHWLTNRWAQNWVGITAGADLDPYFKDKKPEWIVQQAEKFYTSMGFAALPPTFWQKSDLYPATGDRHKNSHASAWHLDLDHDVRSLMSVQADTRWFSTAHHELGHIYYFLSYSRPEVPPLLREGANRAFHEGIGELISIASLQLPYLKDQGIIPAGVTIDAQVWLLNEALEHTVAFIPWSAGTISHFEYELYEKDLPPDQWQKRWWELVEQYQKVASPTPDRLTDPKLCDACTKTHINDDPAQYYDYAIATVLKYQLHEHIATKILRQDPRACNYYGNAQVGSFLKGILQQGATRDWRVVLKEATGEDLSTRAMVAYFKPLQGWLEGENAKVKSVAVPSK